MRKIEKHLEDKICMNDATLSTVAIDLFSVDNYPPSSSISTREVVQFSMKVAGNDDRVRRYSLSPGTATKVSFDGLHSFQNFFRRRSDRDI